MESKINLFNGIISKYAIFYYYCEMIIAYYICPFTYSLRNASI